MARKPWRVDVVPWNEAGGRTQYGVQLTLGEYCDEVLMDAPWPKRNGALAQAAAIRAAMRSLIKESKSPSRTRAKAARRKK